MVSLIENSSYEDIESLASLIADGLNKQKNNLKIDKNMVLKSLASAGGYKSISDLYKDKNGFSKAVVFDLEELPLEQLLVFGTIEQIMDKVTSIKKSLKLNKSSDKQAFEMIEMMIFACHQMESEYNNGFIDIDAIKESLTPENILAYTSIGYGNLYVESDFYEKLNLFYTSLPGNPSINNTGYSPFSYEHDTLNGHAINKVNRVSENALTLLDEILNNKDSEEYLYQLDYIFDTWLRKSMYGIIHCEEVAWAATEWAKDRNKETEKTFVLAISDIIELTMAKNEDIYNQISSLLPYPINFSKDKFITETIVLFINSYLKATFLGCRGPSIPKNKNEYNLLLNKRKQNYGYQEKNLLRYFYTYDEINNGIKEDSEFKKNYPDKKYISAFESPLSMDNLNMMRFFRSVNLATYDITK